MERRSFLKLLAGAVAVGVVGLRQSVHPKLQLIDTKQGKRNIVARDLGARFSPEAYLGEWHFKVPDIIQSPSKEYLEMMAKLTVK